MDGWLLGLGGVVAGLVVVALALAWAFRPRVGPSRLAPPSGREDRDPIAGMGGAYSD